MKEISNCIQDQAAAVLLLVSAGTFLWDRSLSQPLGIGPRTRTLEEIGLRSSLLTKLAAAHEKEATEYQGLGNWRAAQTLREFAIKNRAEADTRPDPRNPWVVSRTSDRWGDDWERGLIIEITQHCTILFGKKLLGTVATLSNVTLDRQDISKGTVQGVVRHLSVDITS